jgi:MFS family permease
VLWQAAAGLLAQITQGAAGVGIILVIRGDHGSLALAGAVVGASSIAAGLARPVQGRLIDRRGAGGVMRACGVVHPAALGGIVGLASAGVPGAVLVVLGVLAGVALPPVSTSMRVVWGEAAGDGDRTAAYSLVYLTQELSILAGPLLLAALIALASASAAVLAIAGLSSLGTLAFATSVSRTPRLAVDRSGAALRGRGVRLLVAIAALLGGVIGGIEVGVPTLASAHGAPAASGLLIAALSVGGIVGAACYGSRSWRRTAAQRLLVLLACVTAPVVVIGAAASGLVVVGILMVLTGVAFNPSLTTISLLVDRHTPGRTAAEAFGWLSTGIAGGTGAASAIAGVVSQRHGDARPAFVVAAVAALAATALAAATRRLLAHDGVILQ